jgi:hypothetical protein
MARGRQLDVDRTRLGAVWLFSLPADGDAHPADDLAGTSLANTRTAHRPAWTDSPRCGPCFWDSLIQGQPAGTSTVPHAGVVTGQAVS